MKFMNMKRFGSIVMAGALALSLTAPAFAASTQPKHSTVIEGAYAETPIAVTVPTTGTAKINPFGLPVSMVKSDGETKVNIVGQQITHEVLSVRNNGDVALDMGVKAFSVLPKGGEVSIAASKDTDKAIKVELQVAGLDNAKYAVSSAEETLPDLLMDAFADDATWASATSLTAPAVSATDTSLPNGTDPASTPDNSPAAVLGAATVADGEVTYGKDSIALFRLKGDMAKEPKTGTTENPWETTDGFTATVVFKFTPHQAVGASVSLDNSTLSIAFGSTGSLTATFDAGESNLTVTKYEWTSDNTSVVTVPVGGAASSTTATLSNAVSSGAGQGTANVTVTVTLSDGSTVTDTCAVTCADS